jgi:glyoxylase-like metal-dependent hydrolase (beta-lactamase superfamily II)
MSAEIQHFFDPQSSTLTYVVSDSKSRDAVVIDPVWDFDAASGDFSTAAFDKVLDFLQEKSLTPCFVLETHAHADHISSSQLFKKYFPDIQVVISERIAEVQKAFAPVYNFSESDYAARSFDVLVKDQSRLQAGSLNIQVIATPGHTPACVSYLIEEALFTGDALFMPDSGSGRCDFPGGSAEALYHSVTEKIFALPPTTRLFVGHDYQPQGRDLKYCATVTEQKSENIHFKNGTTLASFVDFRQKRDATLAAPKLLQPAMKVNLMAGHAST